MSRSVKKGPYIEASLAKKVSAATRTTEKRIIKTWSRDSTIIPDMVGLTIAVHDGRRHVLSSSVRTWSATSSGSLLPRGTSAVTSRASGPDRSARRELWKFEQSPKTSAGPRRRFAWSWTTSAAGRCVKRWPS